MLKDWTWQTKEGPVAALICTLLRLDDNLSGDRIHATLLGKWGFIRVVKSPPQGNHNQGGGYNYQHHQYDTSYNNRQQSLQQKYLELLKGLCAMPQVQSYVQEAALIAAEALQGQGHNDSGVDVDGEIDGEQYIWLHLQIQKLLRAGKLDASYLLTELSNTRVRVSGAGEAAVNGTYHFSGLMEAGTSLYKLEGVRLGSKIVTFQIYRCRMDNKVYQWFISIVPPNKEPGTSSDIDFYCQQSTYKPRGNNNNHHNNQYNQQNSGLDVSLSDDGDEDIKPPEGRWTAVSTAQGTQPAPIITWITSDDPDFVDGDIYDIVDGIDDDSPRPAPITGVNAGGGAGGAHTAFPMSDDDDVGIYNDNDDSESDGEDCMAVIDDEERYEMHRDNNEEDEEDDI
jgi:hypothetical protein